MSEPTPWPYPRDELPVRCMKCKQPTAMCSCGKFCTEIDGRLIVGNEGEIELISRRNEE